MRKTSYFIAFLAIGFSLTLNVLSITQPTWLTVRPDTFHPNTRITYGLRKRCQSTLIDFPSPGESDEIRYSVYTCRPFPTREDDGCNSEDAGNDGQMKFCVLWRTAGYASELSLIFGGAAALAISFAVTTRSRRRRVWRAVAGLEVFHAAFKILCFGLITGLYHPSRLPLFEYTRPGTAFVCNVLSWMVDVFIFFGVLVTGLSADAGHPWAAGNRAYRSLSTSNLF